jgi:hypothetical protein
VVYEHGVTVTVRDAFGGVVSRVHQATDGGKAALGICKVAELRELKRVRRVAEQFWILRERKRPGRNPRTGESVKVKASKVGPRAAEVLTLMKPRLELSS